MDTGWGDHDRYMVQGVRCPDSCDLYFTGFCVYNNPSPNTDSLFMEFWYPWIYFCILWEFLFQATQVLSHCCWEYFRNRGIGGRRKEAECKVEQWAVLTKLSWRQTWVPSYVQVCSGKGIVMCLPLDQSLRPGAEELWLSLPPCLQAGWGIRHLRRSSESGSK